MSLAQPRRAWLFASLCTVASVAGGVLGYAIGALFCDWLGHWLIHCSDSATRSRRFARRMRNGAPWIIISKGLTPIPYKYVTITSGFTR